MLCVITDFPEISYKLYATFLVAVISNSLVTMFDFKETPDCANALKLETPKGETKR